MRKSLVFACATVVGAVSADVFPGWQGLRVIKADNGAYKLMSIRDREDGGQSLLGVDTRQSRLEFFRYTGKKGVMTAADFENPNFLPMAEDFEKVELRRDRLPQVAEVFDVDQDGIDEIFLIQSDPRKLVALKKDGSEWKTEREWEIAESDLSTSSPILARRVGGGLQILISLSDGIQIIDYDTPKEVEWLRPRERDIERNRWWLVDLDGDGDEDIVEAQNTVSSPIRWYEAEGKALRPAVNISEEISNTNVARLIRGSQGPVVAFMGANQANTISFFDLGRGEESKFGMRNLLPLSQPDSAGWATLEVEGAKSIVEIDRIKPILNVYQQDGAFWKYRSSYPILQDVVAIKSIGGGQGTLLLRVKDEGQLYESHWDGSRFTFPKRLGESTADSGDWKILAFDQFDGDTWWVTQQGKSLVLRVWNRDASGPEETVFPDLDGEFESSVWLGGKRLLVKKKFSKTTSFCYLEDGKAQLSTARFKGSEFARIRRHGPNIYLLENGVVQKLGTDLEVVDQIMLDGDHTIRSFAPISETTAYALASDGEHLHLMEADESGIFHTVERSLVPYAMEVQMHPLLGLILVGTNSINVPTAGSSRQLVLASSVDPNENANRDYEKKTLGTLFSVDIEGDGVDEIATVDYGQRDVIIYGEDGKGGYRQVISWKVYDDGKYPYGQDAANRGGVNPYRMLSLDIDADGSQDLVLASHDRILIYLAKDLQP